MVHIDMKLQSDRDQLRIGQRYISESSMNMCSQWVQEQKSSMKITTDTFEVNGAGAVTFTQACGLS